MIHTLRNGWSLSLLLCLLVNASQAQTVVTADGPLTPEAALKAFQCQAEMRVELVAAEPLVVSPVAMAFDERGRLFVAENRGYPTGPVAGEEPLGRIALLTDTNGDGQMDTRSEFATGLTFPNGLLPWRDGVIVTCAPDVLFLRDTNDDGVADQRQVLFTGFSTGGSTQLRVSHPTLSLDNWIYVTSGLTGGKIVAPGNANQPAVEIKRTDFRFRPDSLVGEAADGGAQFGISFDDFGRRFICYNRVQVQHVVLPSRVLARHPQLAFSETVQNCPVETVAEPLKGHGQAARLFPISANVTTADSHAGTFTAACAVTVFRGTGLPAAYQGGVFSCDPTGNLVHFDLLEPRGATFGARSAHAGVEFLASSDSWCRPVFLSSGPDGALYVCDMYRRTIEHPDYLPVEIRKHTDFEGGKTMGRIWRVVRSDLPKSSDKQREVNFAQATTAELVAALGSPDGWRRDTAQRLLLQKRDAAALAPLRELLDQAETSPATYVQALNLLATLDQVDDESLRGALAHPAPPVREQALVLVEPRLASDAKWLDTILPLAKDANPRVRFQLAIALGALRSATDERITTALASIAAQGSDDRWVRAAVFSSLQGRELSFLSMLTTSEDQGKAGTSLDLWKELGRLIGASQSRAAWPDVVRTAVDERAKLTFPQRAALVAGLAEAARGKVSDSTGGFVLALLLDDKSREIKPALDKLCATASEVAATNAQPLDARRMAVQLLGYTEFEQAHAALLKLVDPSQPSELQSQAIRSLGLLRDARVARELLASRRFAAYTPGLREDVLAAVIADPQHAAGLLDALEAGDLPVGAIDALRRRILTQHKDAALRVRAEKLFGAVAGDRAQVYAELKAVVDWKADAARGRDVFKRNCAACHRLDRDGFAVGPDLFGIRNQPKPAILLHILAPDQEITQGFTAYTVLTSDGRSLTGLIVAETPTTVTLRLPQGKEEQLLRDDIEELIASKLSLMPQGLEKNISKQEFADLLAYLKGEQAAAP